MISDNRSKKYRDLVIAYKQTFGTPNGKLVLFDLMNRNFILNGHSGDVHKEGQRAAVLDIMKKCNISIEKLDELLKGE